MRHIWFLQLFTLLSTLQAKSTVNDMIVVSATYCDEESLFFSYQNYFGDHIISNQVNITNGWRVIHTNDPVLLVFSRDWKLYPVYALPGDTINASCNEPSGIEFFGNRSHYDLNMLSVIEKKVGFLWPSLMGLRITKRLSFDYLTSSFDSLYKERRKVLQSSKEIPEDLNALFLQFMKYRIAGDYLIPYISPNRDIDFNLIADIPPSYLAKFNSVKLPIDDSSMQVDRLYRTYLLDYNEYLAQDSIRSGKGRYRALYNTAKHHFEGPSKDFLLFKLIKDSLIDKPEFVNDFRLNCKNSLFINYIDSLIEIRNNLTKDSEVLRGSLSKPDGTVISFEDLLKIHKGKPIYIDFWASWCGPCIAEIEPLKEMEKAFKNKVDFISISIDEEKNKWLKAIRKYSLNTGNQWLMAKDSPLAKYLAIQSIPRFILIDKYGQVVSLNGPRPSNTLELGYLLNQVLK
jgi:thiol-disulfide isomerase/thioredoxin